MSDQQSLLSLFSGGQPDFTHISGTRRLSATCGSCKSDLAKVSLPGALACSCPFADGSWVFGRCYLLRSPSAIPMTDAMFKPFKCPALGDSMCRFDADIGRSMQHVSSRNCRAEARELRAIKDPTALFCFWCISSMTQAIFTISGGLTGRNLRKHVESNARTTSNQGDAWFE